jgi:TatA/E family protein of Tat protein translocase
MGNVGPMEIVVVLIIALVVFGPKKLPELGQSLGEGIRGFKSALEGTDEPEVRQVDAEKQKPEPQPPAA